MLASVIIAIFVYFYSPLGDHGALDTLKLIIEATASGLGLMGLWHLIRAPWLLEREKGRVEKKKITGLFSAVGLSIILLIIFGGIYGVVHFYRDLSDELQLYKGRSIYYMSGRNPAYPSTVNTVMAFTDIANPAKLLPDSQKPCQIKITAPRENDDIAITLRTLASAAGCYVMQNGNRDVDPSVDAEENQGAIRDFILVHAKENTSVGGFIVGLGNSFSVKRTFSIPSELNNVIWIQIGPGSPWRKN